MIKDYAMLKIMTAIFILHSIFLSTLSDETMNHLIVSTISMFTFTFITLPLFAFAVIASIIIFFTTKGEK